jgi:hypothetical protein
MSLRLPVCVYILIIGVNYSVSPFLCMSFRLSVCLCFLFL